MNEHTENAVYGFFVIILIVAVLWGFFSLKNEHMQHMYKNAIAAQAVVNMLQQDANRPENAPDIIAPTPEKAFGGPVNTTICIIQNTGDSHECK